MGHYVGVDVGLRSSSLCIVDEQGKVCLEREVASEIDEIADAIRGFSGHVDGVALETGNLTPWLTAGLRAEGFRVVVMEARQVRTTLSSLRNKTDRNDARGIAQILRTGWYREVHVKSLESQRLKTLLAARKALLRRRIDLENEVRGLLKVYGVKPPAQIYHARFDDMARQAVIADPALAEALGPLLDARGHLYRAFLEIDKRVRSIAHDDPICQLLMSAPGVGFVAALTFKAAVDDPKRFRRSKTVAAFWAYAQALPIWRKGQSRPHIQGRRCRGSVCPVPGGQHHHKWPRPTLVFAQLRRPPGAQEGPQTRDGGRRPQTCRCAPCHVDRRHHVLQRREGGARLTM